MCLVFQKNSNIGLNKCGSNTLIKIDYLEHIIKQKVWNLYSISYPNVKKLYNKVGTLYSELKHLWGEK